MMVQIHAISKMLNAARSLGVTQSRRAPIDLLV